MKKNYDELQKKIEELNNMVIHTQGGIDALRDEFLNTDVEMINDFAILLDAKLSEYHKEINGEKNNSAK